jgi:hypothetical protein
MFELRIGLCIFPCFYLFILDDDDGILKVYVLQLTYSGVISYEFY